jgi:hypothetical protein
MGTLKNNQLRNILYNNLKMVQYNIKIIFANRFIYFLTASIIIFLAFTIGNLLTGGAMQVEDAFGVITLSGALILFYPLTFGIQSDKDARTLEIIFGIPDYRYRVWLMRNLLIYLIALIIIIFLSWLINISLVEFNPFKMGIQVLFPLFFMGMFSFFLSTVTRSGNATAVIVIIASIAMILFASDLKLGYWNVFFNPYKVPSNANPIAFEMLAFKNKAFLAAGGIVFLLGGLFKLQEREKFLG